MPKMLMQQRIPKFDAVQWLGNNLAEVDKWRKDFKDATELWPITVRQEDSVLIMRIPAQDLYVLPGMWIYRKQGTTEYFRVTPEEHAANYELAK